MISSSGCKYDRTNPLGTIVRMPLGCRTVAEARPLAKPLYRVTVRLGLSFLRAAARFLRKAEPITGILKHP